MSGTKKNKLFDKVINIALDVFIGIFCVILLVTVYNFLQIKVLNNDYSSFFGYSTFEVQTGSMKSAINIGDWIIVKKENEYKLNDIVTYKQNGNYITHRIIEAYDNTFITRGDANNSDDNPISKSQIVGKTVSVLPYFGAFRKTLFNPAVLIALIVTLYLVGFAFGTQNKNNKYLIKFKKKLVKGKTVSDIAVKVQNIEEPVNTKELLVTLNETDNNKVEENVVIESDIDDVNIDHKVMSEDDLNKTMCFRMIEVDADDIEEDNIEISESEVISEVKKNVKKSNNKVKTNKLNLGIDIADLTEKYKTKKFKNFLEKMTFFKTEEVKNIIFILTNTTEIKKNSIVNLYIDAYIKSRFYNNYLDTSKNVSVEKNISGVFNNISTSYKDVKISYVKEAKVYKDLFGYIIKLDEIDLNKNKKDLLDNMNVILNDYFSINNYPNDRINYILQNLFAIKKEYTSLINDSLNNLDTDMFDLLFNRISARKNYFGLELKHNINFSKVYSDYIVDKVYTEGIVAEDKIIVTLTLLQMQLSNDMINRQFSKKYIIYFPSTLFEKENKFRKVFRMLDDEYAKSSVIILLSYSDLLNHKQVIKKLRLEGYKFAVMFDKNDSFKSRDASIIGTLDLIFIDNKDANSKNVIAFIPNDFKNNIIYEDISLKVGNVKGE